MNNKIRQHLINKDGETFHSCFMESMNFQLGASFASTVIQRENPLLKSPPNIELAKIHGKARKVGKVDKSRTRQQLYCTCCYQIIDKEKFQICCDTGSFAKEFSIGTGVTLFFEMQKYIITLILLVIVVLGNFQYMTQYQQCKIDTRCLSIYGFFYSTYELNQSMKDVYFILTITTISLLIVGTIWMRIQILQKSLILDHQLMNQRNFTILIKNIKRINQKSIIQQVSDIMNPYLSDSSDKVKIETIVWSYKISDYVSAIRKKSELTEIQNGLMHRYSTNLNSEKYLLKLNSIEQQKTKQNKIIQKTKQIIKDKNQDNMLRSQIVFVTLEYEYQTNQILQNFQNNLSLKQRLKILFRFQDQMNMVRASQPLDVIWENLEFKTIKIVKLRLLGFFIQLILFIISFVLLSFLSYFQNKFFNHDKELSLMVRFTLGVTCFIVVTILNNTMTFIVRKLVGYQKHSTYTNQSKSIAFNMSWIFFINSALIPYILLILGRKHYYEYNATDLLGNVFYIVLGNAFFTPLTILVNIWYYYRKFKRFYLLRDNKIDKLTQYQANLLWEDPQFFIDWKYAKISQVYLTSLLFAPVFPLGLYLGLVTLFLIYWVSKYDFINKCQLPNSLSSDLHEVILFNIGCGPLILCMGQFFYSYYVSIDNSPRNDIITIVFMALSIVFAFTWQYLVRSSFVLRKFIKKIKIGRYVFSNIKQFLGISYEMANPISAINKFNEIQQEKQSILEQQQFQQQTQLQGKQSSSMEQSDLISLANNGVSSIFISNFEHNYNNSNYNNSHNNQNSNLLKSEKLHTMSILKNYALNNPEQLIGNTNDKEWQAYRRKIDLTQNINNYRKNIRDTIGSQLIKSQISLKSVIQNDSCSQRGSESHNQNQIENSMLSNQSGLPQVKYTYNEQDRKKKVFQQIDQILV